MKKANIAIILLCLVMSGCGQSAAPAAEVTPSPSITIETPIFDTLPSNVQGMISDWSELENYVYAEVSDLDDFAIVADSVSSHASGSEITIINGSYIWHSEDGKTGLFSTPDVGDMIVDATPSDIYSYFDSKSRQESITEGLEKTDAVLAALNYLEVSAFSKERLVSQLEYEGYSKEAAEYAVENIIVDWNEQAKKAAEQYLEISEFSRNDLRDQLLYDGFTEEQAEYGLNAVGL